MVTYRSATYDFLLTFYGPILYRFRDRRRFQSKIANPPVYFALAAAEGVPLELSIGAWDQKKLESWDYRAEKDV